MCLIIYILKQRVQHLLVWNNAPPHIRKHPHIRRLSPTVTEVYWRFREASCRVWLEVWQQVRVRRWYTVRHCRLSHPKWYKNFFVWVYKWNSSKRCSQQNRVLFSPTCSILSCFWLLAEMKTVLSTVHTIKRQPRIAGMPSCENCLNGSYKRDH